MKKIFLVFAVAVGAMAVSAEDQLVSASWNLIGDSTETCTEFSYQKTLAAGDTLTQNGVSLFYMEGGKVYEPTAGQGAYWHNSNAEKGDNVIALTVPGSSKCTIALTLRPGKKNKEYVFYAFAQNAGGDKPANLYESTASALASSSWMLADYTEGTVQLEFDFMEKSQDQDVYIIYTAETGLRHRGVRYQMTERKSGPSTGVTSVESSKVARKMMVNGQLIIVRDGVRYNALGATL